MRFPIFLMAPFFSGRSMAIFSFGDAGSSMLVPYGVNSISYSGNDLVFYADATADACQLKGTWHRDCIEIRGFRVSWYADTYHPNNRYGGVVIYDVGTYNNGRTSGRLWPGYVMFADTTPSRVANYHAWVRRTPGQFNEGQIHGYTVWRIFGQNPSQMAARYGMKFAGFAVDRGQMKFNSGALNTASYWELQQRTMVGEEQVVVTAVTLAWRAGGKGKTYWASNNRSPSIIPWMCTGWISKHVANPSSFLPICDLFRYPPRRAGRFALPSGFCP